MNILALPYEFDIDDVHAFIQCTRCNKTIVDSYHTNFYVDNTYSNIIEGFNC
jgi:hypothetical protein